MTGMEQNSQVINYSTLLNILFYDDIIQYVNTGKECIAFVVTIWTDKVPVRGNLYSSYIKISVSVA